MSGVDKILVIEDDRAVRITLVELMRMYGYEVEYAENGVQGLEKLDNYVPDIILSDVNMPLMDGNEFVHRLKESKDFAHIPVIMLTASVDEEDKLKGLTSGAVDFISKPFNSTELELKVKNIIATRKQLQDRSWQAIVSKTYQDLPNLDEQFIEDLYNTIVKHISLNTYPARDLAEDLGLSERNLYRKVKENIGITVSDFVREVKLQHAHELLDKKKVRTMAEAALRVGFKSIGHFSRLYNEKFNP